MSTVVATACADAFVIGSETLLSQGDIRLSHDYGHNPKIHRIGDSCIGLTGTVAHYTALVQALRELGDQCQLWGQEQVFATFTRVHRKLKDEYFLNPKKQAEDAYESNHISAMVVNGSGLYGVYAHREVLVFDRFWANGSGRAFALGAMHATWSRSPDAVDAASLARAGLAAAMEFDRASGGRMCLYRFERGVQGPPQALD